MKFAGSFLGVGLLPGPRATYTSAVMAAIWTILHLAGIWPETPAAQYYLPLSIGMAFSIIAIPLGNLAARVEKDPKWFVLDECAGQWIAFSGVGVMDGMGYWFSGFIVFGLFRLFDIIKPWPVCRFEALPAGWGIWADDVAAAVLAGITWHAVAFIAPGL